MRGPFKATLRTEWKPEGQIQTSRKPDELRCRTYEMLLWPKEVLRTQSVTKSIKKPNLKCKMNSKLNADNWRIFLEHLGM